MSTDLQSQRHGEPACADHSLQGLQANLGRYEETGPDLRKLISLPELVQTMDFARPWDAKPIDPKKYDDILREALLGEGDWAAWPTSRLALYHCVYKGAVFLDDTPIECRGGVYRSERHQALRGFGVPLDDLNHLSTPELLKVCRHLSELSLGGWRSTAKRLGVHSGCRTTCALRWS